MIWSNLHMWSGIEVVITGLTRNQLTGNRPWVRIPPAPPYFGMWLSLVEHYVRDVGAAGSNPVIPTTAGCSAGGSALDWGSRCRRFKSCHSDQFLSPHKCLKLQCLCGFFILLLCNVTTWKNIKKHVFCSQTVVRK